ncbi:MAG: hypothetical protein IM674_13550 [Brevundimonas sp.]|nr:hypothetical protein [Brevundimonas sp.]
MKRAALLMLMPIMLASCSATGPAGGDFCQMAAPIRVSAEDGDRFSRETARQIRLHNEVGRRVCGWE